jgi:hypothetical protein
LGKNLEEREIEIKMEDVERKNRRNRIGKAVLVITHQAPI